MMYICGKNYTWEDNHKEAQKIVDRYNKGNVSEKLLEELYHLVSMKWREYVTKT